MQHRKDVTMKGQPNQFQPPTCIPKRLYPTQVSWAPPYTRSPPLHYRYALHSQSEPTPSPPPLPPPFHHHRYLRPLPVPKQSRLLSPALVQIPLRKLEPPTPFCSHSLRPPFPNPPRFPQPQQHASHADSDVASMFRWPDHADLLQDHPERVSGLELGGGRMRGE